MMVMPVSIGVVFSGPTRNARTFERDPSQPTIRFPRSMELSSNVATAVVPVEVIEMRFFLNCLQTSASHKPFAIPAIYYTDILMSRFKVKKVRSFFLETRTIPGMAILAMSSPVHPLI